MNRSKSMRKSEKTFSREANPCPIWGHGKGLICIWFVQLPIYDMCVMVFFSKWTPCISLLHGFGGFGRVMLVPQLVGQMRTSTEWFRVFGWGMFVFVEGTSFFPFLHFSWSQGPPLSSEIRPCMLNHLVELEAVQTIYSLQNGFTCVSLNSHGDYIHTYINTYIHTYINTYIHKYIHT